MEVRDFVVTVKNVKYLAIEKQSGITNTCFIKTVSYSHLTKHCQNQKLRKFTKQIYTKNIL